MQQFISFFGAHFKACRGQNVVFCVTLPFVALSILVLVFVILFCMLCRRSNSCLSLSVSLCVCVMGHAA